MIEFKFEIFLNLQFRICNYFEENVYKDNRIAIKLSTK